MNKVIINCEDGITVYDAMYYVQEVMKMGRISADDTTFCLCTRFKDGTVVIADRTPRGTDTFKLFKE